jgi:hypothetical protein
MRAMVAVYCASYDRPPASVTLDIDDTLDVVHGHQQLSMFNAHYDERCFLPIHIYDTATSRPVAVLLRPGKTPSGREIRGHLRRLLRAIREHWPHTHITIRLSLARVCGMKVQDGALYHPEPTLAHCWRAGYT